MHPRAEAITGFWFGGVGRDLDATTRRWFAKDAAFDTDIRERFAPDIARAAAGELEGWADGEPGELVALVILLDQFPRNVFRGSHRAFAQDGRALAVVDAAIARGRDRALGILERFALYLPLMHSEELAVQRRSVAAYAALAAAAAATPGVEPALVQLTASGVDFAQRHASLIERFGRFPHRNDVLGRTSTPAEAELLARPGAGF